MDAKVNGETNFFTSAEFKDKQLLTLHIFLLRKSLERNLNKRYF